MSETTTGPHPQAPLGEELPIHPSDILLNLIVTLLAPMFLCASGGDILFARFEPETGVVWLNMRGACSGCPSSTATLRAGVENMLKHYVPEVTRVEQTL